MPVQLSERLNAARSRFFVGREKELELFRSTLGEVPLPFQVLHVYGPGGVGKTSLLRAFVQACAQAASASMLLDARTIEPSPEAFLNAIAQGLHLPPGTDVRAHLAAWDAPFVLLIDSYESIAALDDWLRGFFLPVLSERTLTVLAGKCPPAPAWRADPGWQALVQVLPLRNLAPEESRDYLTRRGIAPQQQPPMLAFTHGHPLALSLLADVFTQRPTAVFVPEETPDVVRTLLEQFIQEVPGEQQRNALEACAMVRVSSEALLGSLLACSEIHALFEWLRSLSFVEASRDGVFPHELAREALVSDLRWRNPDWYNELHRRARGYYLARLDAAAGQDQQRLLWDFIFLHRDNASVRPFFEWQTSVSVPAAAPGSHELPALVAMVRQQEGPELAAFAAAWLNCQPSNAVVLHDAAQQPAGFVSWVDLTSADPTLRAADPATRAAWDWIQHQVPLRSGERALLFRFWMARDSYQAVSPLQSLLFVHILRLSLTTPGLAFSFLPAADAQFWAPGFTYADLHLLPSAGFACDRHEYGVFVHDWRAVPPLAWLDLLGERELGLPPSAAGTAPAQHLLILSAEEFDQAVRAALRGYARPELLRANPLLRSRLVLGQRRPANEMEAVQRLRQKIQQAAATFQTSPKDEKLGRVLEKTYFHPAPTQESAAALLDLPFSTYRRHLKSATARITGLLWIQETARESF